MEKQPKNDEKEEQLRLNVIVAKADAFDAFLNYDQSSAKWREALDKVRLLTQEYNDERQKRANSSGATTGVSGQAEKEA